MKRIIFLLTIIATAVTSVMAADNDLGALELGKTYTIKAYADNMATFTATTDGVITYSSTNTYEMRPYTAADYKTEVEQFNRTGAAGGYSGQHSYDFKVTAGTVYYFYLSFAMGTSDFTLTMAGDAKVELNTASPELNSVYNLTSGGGQMSWNFNKPVTFSNATLQIGDNAAESISVITTSNSLFTNDVQAKVWNAMKNGTAHEGDKFVVTITGIALASDATVLYNGDGILKAEYTIGKKPISLVSTENFTSYGDFLSFYSTKNDNGVVKLQFDGKLTTDTTIVTNIRFGNLDKDFEGEYYYENVTPVLSDDGTALIINLQGKRRRQVDMLPDQASDTKYETIILHVAGVKDSEGTYAYSDGQGSLGSYDCIYNFKEITANIAVDYDPASGGEITGNSIEVWIADESKLSYDGVRFTYTKDGETKTADVAKSLITKEVDTEDKTANILTIPVPDDVFGAKDIVLTFINLESADGSDYSSVLTATYSTATSGISQILRDDEDTDNAPHYNIAGQRISPTAKGINIVKGKKIIK